MGLVISRTSRASELEALCLCGPQADRRFCEGIHSMPKQVFRKNQMNIEEAAALGVFLHFLSKREDLYLFSSSICFYPVKTNSSK